MPGSLAPFTAEPDFNAKAHAFQIWQRREQGYAPEITSADAFPIYPDDPLAPEQRTIAEYLRQTSTCLFAWKPKPEEFSAGRTLLDPDPIKMTRVVRAVIVRLLFWKQSLTRQNPRVTGVEAYVSEEDMVESLVSQLRSMFPGAFPSGQGEQFTSPLAIRPVMSDLLRFDLSLSTSDVAALVELAIGTEPHRLWHPLSADGVVHAAERHIAIHGLMPELLGPLEAWSNSLAAKERLSGAERKIATRLSTLIGAVDVPGIVAGDAWSDAALAELRQMSPEQRAGWTKLLRHCELAESSKPTQKWMRAADGLVKAVGSDDFRDRALRWFEWVALPRPVHREPSNQWEPDPDQLIDPRNAVILKGLAWCFGGWRHPDVSRGLAALAEVCFKKVRLLGPRCPKVGNACLISLSATPSNDAAAQLSRLDQRVKQPTAKKRISKSLDLAAALTGQTREDLEELSVPSYGLDANGLLREVFGEFTAEFCLDGADALQLCWRAADGKIQKSIPPEVKERHAAELKQFKRTLSDIEKMLPAQRTRLERLLLSPREWAFEQWQARYFNHPLLASTVRRLIWHFQQGERTSPGIWHDGRWMDVAGQAMDWVEAGTRVRLWHPYGSDVATVAAWRRRLETREVQQPFKQAHREIYVLTDAERQTATYSNRFAAHIIKQHQFAALAQQRGWQYRLMGSFDFHSTPTLVLPQWRLSVEYWVEQIEDREEASASGISRYLSTDQVRFCGPGGASIPLTDVPPIVFSEVMRDVDLFVAVTSIGADPQWADAGLLRGNEYWRQYALGEMSATAKVRHGGLGRLLPKLKIASRCELQERFLVVRGDLRTYKIHLGSGNILMEPNDQYLCIVPDRRPVSGSKEVFLPFEGDTMLSIIVSKAFLLSNDAGIKDQTILGQIKR